jgi:tyrosyl-tRNA synthetase
MPNDVNEKSFDTILDQLTRGADALFSRVELRAKLKKSQTEKTPLRIKLGLDPTAPDIHLGFAVVLRKLRAFQDAGHEAHLIIGDFTAQIGDPTGKSKTRPKLTKEQVKQNAETYQEQLFRILDKKRSVIYFNSDWLGKMSFSEVIELAAKYTVAQTLEREDFRTRMEANKPLGLHEILYPLCQGQDSVEIKSDVELGGSDQRFNNLVGRELQRANGQESQVVILMPLLVGTDGVNKMSKSLGNYIGINEAPGEMFGKVMSIPDSALETYYVLCTEVPLDEVKVLLAGHPMEAKKRLAREIVTIYHDAEAANAAQEGFEKQFSRNEIPDDMPEDSLPETEISATELLRQCFDITGGEAKRLIAQGAVSLDGEKINDPQQQITPKEGLVIKAGKRRWAKVALNT